MGESAAKRVARGAAWQDEHKPGWERLVDLSVLDLEHGCRCILGQSWATEAIDAQARNGYSHVLWNIVFPRFEPAAWAMRHGFEGGSVRDYRNLDEAWIALLKERFASGCLSDERGES